MNKHIYLPIVAALLISCTAAPTRMSDAVIQTEKGHVEAWKGKASGPIIDSERTLTPVETDQLKKKSASFSLLKERYGLNVSSEITPELLERVFSAWVHDTALDRPEQRFVVEAVGVNLGNLLCLNAGYEWRVMTDRFGTTFGITHPQTKMLAFPIDSIEKRATRGETNFIARLYYAVKDIRPSSSK